MSDLTAAIRAQARDLLARGRVEYVVGYETGSDGVNARPFFVRTVEEADRLVFDNTCTHNLAKYLGEPERRGHMIGVVVKPCDARSLNVLLGENKFPRDVVAIGVVCPGIVQRTREGGDGATLQPRCQSCDQHTPVVCDILVGDALPGGESEQLPLPPGDVGATGRSPLQAAAQLEALDARGRSAFWAAHFSRCIRCYACRQVCPQCYCGECFAESLDPEWVGIRIGEAENWLFHTIRAFHLAGRCVGCDECERVCPVNIPLSLLNGRLRREVWDKFQFQAGLKPDEPPPLATFRKEEKLDQE